MNSESQLLLQLEKPGVRSTDDYFFCFDEEKTTMKIGQIDYDSQKDATQITMSFSIKPGEEDTVEIRYAREGEVLSHFKLIGISEDTTGTP